MLDDLLKAAGKGSPFAPVATPPPPPRDEPLSSYNAMNAEADALPQVEHGTPILPCQKPTLGITLTDADGEPVAGAPYTLTVDGHGSRSGVLDAQGHVEIEDLELDSSEWNVEVELETSEDADPVYHVSLTRSAKAANAPVTDDSAERLVPRENLLLEAFRT